MDEEDKYSNTENIIKNISLERKYESHEIKTTFVFSKGENYLGDIKRATLTGVKDNGESEILHLIIKTAPDNVRNEFPVNVYYEREMFAYSIFLPMLTNMQDGLDIPDEGKIRFAELYGGSTDNLSEVLIFEDLQFDGFKMYNRLKSLDYNHLMLTIKTLALFHAHSFAAKQLIPELYSEAIAKSFKRGDFGVNFGDSFERFKKKSISVIQDDDHREKVSKYSEGKVFEKLLDILMDPPEDSTYNVICHGDCWINNCLFKYDENNIPVKMVLVDWQMNNYSSPVTDLAYLIFSCTDKDVRSQYWDEIFRTYYKTLKERLEILGCDANECYPEEVFKQHLKDKLPAGLIWSFMIVPIVLNDKDVGKDLNDLLTDEEDDDGFMRYSEHCIDRLNGVVRDFVKLGYI